MSERINVPLDQVEPLRHPIRVQTPHTLYDRTRMIIHNGRVYLFSNTPTGVQLVEDAVVASLTRERNPRAAYLLTTSEGEAWECRRAGGCGCGPLGSFDWQTAIANQESLANA